MIISVIVPIYNIETYISKCIDSILNQTFKDFQLILVDDGSTDKSGLICDQYAKQHSNVLVIHQKNQGLSASRNNGLKMADGKYVTFIDGDDLVSSHYLEILFKPISSGTVSLSACAHSVISENVSIFPEKDYCSDCDVRIVSGQTAVETILENNAAEAAWGVLAPKTIWERNPFPVGRAYEDLPVTWKVYLQCDKIAFIKKDLYGYRFRRSSISKLPSLKNMRDYKLSMEDLESGLEEESSISKVSSSFCLCLNSIRLYNQLSKLPSDDKEILSLKKWSRDFFLKHYFKIIFSLKGNVKQRIRFIVFLFSPRFEVYLTKKYFENK